MKATKEQTKLFKESELSDYYESVQEMLEDEENYLCDKISECADGNVDIYTYDLKKWAGTPEGQEWTERAIEEFGWEGVGETLDKAYSMGQYLQNQEELQDEFEEIKNA